MKAATVAEKRHMAAVEALGCIVKDMWCGGRTTIHHVRLGGAKRDHMRVLPLCQLHHQEGRPGVSIERAKKTRVALTRSPLTNPEPGRESGRMSTTRGRLSGRSLDSSWPRSL